MKIGILGGTFDPIHLGHIELAQAAVSSLNLDKVVFMPCHIPPHKTRKDIASPQDRLHMIRLAIKNHPKYELSGYEIKQGGTSFSINTITYFKRVHPNDQIFFIVGSDSYIEFSTWKDCSQILKLAKLAVAQRPPKTCNSLQSDVLEIKMQPSRISSSEIRSKIKQGETIENLVSDKVREYIAKKKLYIQKQS